MQSRVRIIFKKPKSGDDCSRFVRFETEISTGIEGYVCPLKTRSYVPFAALDAAVIRVTIAF